MIYSKKVISFTCSGKIGFWDDDIGGDQKHSGARDARASGKMPYHHVEFIPRFKKLSIYIPLDFSATHSFQLHILSLF